MFRNYIASIWILGVLIGYELLAMVGYIAFQWEIMIPCPSQLLLGFECWGCGLSHAVIFLFKGQPAKALEANGLIFLIIPAFILFIYLDFRHFKKSYADKVH